MLSKIILIICLIILNLFKTKILEKLRLESIRKINFEYISENCIGKFN